jgi:hypothetical protein
MILFNSGPTRSDPTCRDREVSVPHVAVGETPQHSERFVAVGIEGGNFSFPVEAKVGYRLHPEDKFKVLMDMMNEKMVTRPNYAIVLNLTQYRKIKGFTSP